MFNINFEYYLKKPKALVFWVAVAVIFLLYFNNSFSGREADCKNKCKANGLDYKYTPHSLDVLGDYVEDNCICTKQDTE